MYIGKKTLLHRINKEINEAYILDIFQTLFYPFSSKYSLIIPRFCKLLVLVCMLIWRVVLRMKHQQQHQCQSFFNDLWCCFITKSTNSITISRRKDFLHTEPLKWKRKYSLVNNGRREVTDDESCKRWEISPVMTAKKWSTSV